MAAFIVTTVFALFVYGCFMVEREKQRKLKEAPRIEDREEGEDPDYLSENDPDLFV